MRVERQRRKEQERIAREREELRRQQEQLRAEQERRALRRPCDLDARRDDMCWLEGKRIALEDRYLADFPRPDHRFHDFDHRERGQYQDHIADRRDGPRLPVGERDVQHYSDDRHTHAGPPERHSRDSRDGWGGYSTDKRLSEGRGLPPAPRSSRDWTEHQTHAWQGALDTEAMSREHLHWQGADRGLGPPGHAVASRGGVAGRGSSFAPGHSQGHVVPGGGMEGGGVASQDRNSRAPPPHPHMYPHFTRRY